MVLLRKVGDMTMPRTCRAVRADDAPIRAIGYVRVSTDEQAESGAGLDAQRKTITAHAAALGWVLDVAGDQGYSAKDVESRPALVDALHRLDRGDADVLVAAKLDRVSRSSLDFALILDRARRAGWRVVLLDLGVDTTTPVGEMTAGVIASTAQYERRLIGQRTREGLAAKRAAGVRLGRPSSIPADVVERIVRAREDGRSLPGIAADLTADGVPTTSGRPTWSHSTVQRVLSGQDAAAVRVRLGL
jgi:DNA invertase Pin-like site-specific DNA recombinase